MDIVVQPSVSWMELNEEIKESGLFFPVDPGPPVCFHVTHHVVRDSNSNIRPKLEE